MMQLLIIISKLGKEFLEALKFPILTIHVSKTLYSDCTLGFLRMFSLWFGVDQLDLSC